MTTVDFGRHSDDYARHRPGFPQSFYARLAKLLPLEGTRSLDLATGPGIIAVELGKRGSRATGIDISAQQIAAAARMARDCRVDHLVDFLVAPAEDTRQDEAAFDLVTAGQCWHWFDGARVLAEARRVLRPGGSLVVAHYSYLAEHSEVAGETERLILEFNPSWTMAGAAGVYPEQIDDLIRGGFELLEQFCYQENERFTHEAWRGRVRTCNGVGSGGLAPPDVERFDEALARMLSHRFPEPLLIEHRVWCVIGRKPQAG